ncbi:hypothetical protein B0O80DRAFT_425320 [Mortierella sp. GBAus27b]|nr:hypothetical protein B0O80DRAFT_425320 [Mortierella sp. GBAus27b]
MQPQRQIPGRQTSLNRFRQNVYDPPLFLVEIGSSTTPPSPLFTLPTLMATPPLLSSPPLVPEGHSELPVVPTQLALPSDSTEQGFSPTTNMIPETNYLPFQQYKQLVKRGREVEVILYDTTCVTIFTDAFSKPSNTEKMIIRIDPTYFEAPERSEGAPFKSIERLFNELGQALQDQEALRHLEIHCNSLNGGEVYFGLRAVFQCRSLETLVVSNIPRFLQDHDIPINCQRLKELELQGVHLEGGAASEHLKALLAMNPNLLTLRVI